MPMSTMRRRRRPQSLRSIAVLCFLLSFVEVVSFLQEPVQWRQAQAMVLFSSSSPTLSSSFENTPEYLHENFVFRPPIDKGAPRALIHFLGGALVGRAPHISYRFLCERLAQAGYLVVSTPYDLSFDHLSACDQIISRFETIAADVARTYGPLPVVGVGHSCGALLHVMVTSLFPDTPRAANALISFNNKPVSDAVPFFEEIVTPFFTYIAARNETRPSSSEMLSIGLRIAQASARGEIPSDELLTRAFQLAAPPGFRELAMNQRIGIPDPFRDAIKNMARGPSEALASSGATTLLVELLQTLEQIPQLIDEVADGARDFVPPPSQVKAATRRAYRARRTLIINYSDDPIDESDEIEELLQAAEQVIRMRRPMVQIDVERVALPGNHASPLLAPPLDLAMRFENLLGEDVSKEQLRYIEADRTVQELIRWLEESNL